MEMLREERAIPRVRLHGRDIAKSNYAKLKRTKKNLPESLGKQWLTSHSKKILTLIYSLSRLPGHGADASR
jgi:hypothetical protein